MTARVRVNDPPAVRIAVRDAGAVAVGIDERSPVVPAIDEFPGPYEITPGDAAQTFRTDGLLMARDLTVGPIPSNYGLIEWDGAVLTVS